MHALAGQRVQVGREGGHERLTLAGPHLGDLALVQCDAAHELHVEVPLAEGALGRLPHRGERLRQQAVEGLAGEVAAPELRGLVAKLLVREGLEFGL